MQKKAKTQDYLKPSAKTGVQNYLMIASNLSAKRKHDIKAFMAITNVCSNDAKNVVLWQMLFFIYGDQMIRALVTKSVL